MIRIIMCLMKTVHLTAYIGSYIEVSLFKSTPPPPPPPCRLYVGVETGVTIGVVIPVSIVITTLIITVFVTTSLRETQDHK